MELSEEDPEGRLRLSLEPLNERARGDQLTAGHRVDLTDEGMRPVMRRAPATRRHLRHLR